MDPDNIRNYGCKFTDGHASKQPFAEYNWASWAVACVQKRIPYDDAAIVRGPVWSPLQQDSSATEIVAYANAKQMQSRCLPLVTDSQMVCGYVDRPLAANLSHRCKFAGLLLHVRKYPSFVMPTSMVKVKSHLNPASFERGSDGHVKALHNNLVQPSR